MYSSYYRGIIGKHVSVRERRDGEKERERVWGSGEAACCTDITAAVLSGLIQNAHTRLTSDSGSHQTLAQSGSLYRLLLGSFQLAAQRLNIRCNLNIHAGYEPHFFSGFLSAKKGQDTSVAAASTSPALLSWEKPSLLEAAFCSLAVASKQLAQFQWSKWCGGKMQKHDFN